jgi:hypothetical protein
MGGVICEDEALLIRGKNNQCERAKPMEIKALSHR